MKVSLRGGSCIVGCTLTRASRRLQKKRNRRAACPLPQLSGRGIFRRRRLLYPAGERASGRVACQILHRDGRGIFRKLSQNRDSPSGEGSSEIPQAGTLLYVGGRIFRKAPSTDSRYIFASGLAVRSAEPQHRKRRQGQRERPFE